MAAHLRLASLAPSGLIVESISESEDAVVVSARARTPVRACPLCGTESNRVHSRYVRTISDLPCAGRRVGLRLGARRSICEKPSCRRRIFAERFDDRAVAGRCRRTMRLECIVHHLGLALGGRPAAGFAKRLMVPVSNDTLLRVVRRRASLHTETVNVAGIEIIAMERSFAILNGGGSWHCCPTARWRQLPPGLPIIPRSGSCRVIVRWVRGGGCEGFAERPPGRRPLALDGERKRGVPRRGAQIHARDPGRDRRGDDQSRSAHLR